MKEEILKILNKYVEYKTSDSTGYINEFIKGDSLEDMSSEILLAIQTIFLKADRYDVYGDSHDGCTWKEKCEDGEYALWDDIEEIIIS